jgi:hypothetical protein
MPVVSDKFSETMTILYYGIYQSLGGKRVAPFDLGKSGRLHTYSLLYTALQYVRYYKDFIAEVKADESEIRDSMFQKLENETLYIRLDRVGKHEYTVVVCSIVPKLNKGEVVLTSENYLRFVADLILEIFAYTLKRSLSDLEIDLVQQALMFFICELERS